jgi:hypothetical protein
MPGVEFTSDETFKEDTLRIMTTGGISAAGIREQVQEARAKYQAMAKEEDWPEDAIPLPLMVAVVPRVVLCNPDLYETHVVRPGCSMEPGYYRPYERSLYVVPNDKGEVDELAYWIATIRCMHSKVTPNCPEVINKRFPTR